jgi:uncharacterized protein
MEIAKQIKKLIIQKKYKPFVHSFISGIQVVLVNNIHSIYLCGSIGVGKAIPHKSDADFTIVVKSALSNTDYKKIEEIKFSLLKIYSFIPKIDSPVCTVADVINKPYEWGFWIKVVCVCISGKDLGETIPPLYPCIDLIRGLNTDTGPMIEDLTEKLIQTREKKLLIRYCRKLSRKLIRALFTLVIVKEQTWTDNIKKSIRFLIDNYPGNKKMIKKLYRYYKHPIHDKERILKITQKAKYWFDQEYILILTSVFHPRYP